jgi:hypothetical protein
MGVGWIRTAALSIAITSAAVWAWPQNVATSPPAALTAAQIVGEMQRHDQVRRDGLKHYQAQRHYDVQYRGFASKIAGSMEVEVTYDASTGKSFRIVSESGSKILCEKVLKRAIDSEKEAAQDRKATALTEANYRFHLAGDDSVNGRPAYVLDVEPLTSSKFLYRGKIWVDAEDFALAKVESEPAKNPSFWISRTHISFTNAKTGGFWLPEHNRSETKVRVGGTAVLTIDYGKYQTAPPTLEATSGR